MECPACGHEQAEPATVVGTICVQCRESFPVPPLPSSEPRHPESQITREIRGRLAESWRTLKSRWHRRPESARLGRGTFVASPFTLVDSEDAPEVRGTRRVACPFCQAPVRLPSSALSHCCAECGRHFPLANHDISGVVHANLATAGAVAVHHAGSVTSAWMRCGELVVHGRVTGAVTVTGRAEYHGTGESVGELHCGHLVVARGAHRIFHQRVFAMAADIHGELTGDVCCAGRLQVSRGGAVHGSVLAGQLALDAGGRINGSMATLTAVLRPESRLTATARELLRDFRQDRA